MTSLGQPQNVNQLQMNWAYQICQQPNRQVLVPTTRLFATLFMKGYTSVMLTLAIVLQIQNVYASKMISVPNLLAERARETVIPTLNVRVHLFVGA